MRWIPPLLLVGLFGVDLFAGNRLDETVRRRVDERALAVPVESTRDATKRGLGGAAAWLVADTPLRADEEARRLDGINAAIIGRFNVQPLPESVAEVLRRLNTAIPKPLRPEGEGFEVVLLDDPATRIAFTQGGGRLYVPQGLLEELGDDDSSGSDARIAFALARQMGHVVQGHANRDARLERIGETTTADSRTLVGKGASVAATTGLQHWLPKAVEPNDEREADLFALHLCRNAGFDLEDGLDVLRHRVLAAGRDDDVAIVRLLRRLCAVRCEIDGSTGDERYGLFAFDDDRGEWVRAEDGAVTGPVVLFVHGMESAPAVWDGLRLHLEAWSQESADEEPHVGDVTYLAYRYPNDGSLWGAGRGLSREIARVVCEPESIDFVAHSAGGLVTRVHTELERGAFRRAVFLGTPHGGSDLAKLRVWLEVTRFTGTLRMGYTEAIAEVLEDGEGQMSFDLRPGSLFLSHLAAADVPPTVRSRYTNIRARRWNTAQGLGLRAGFAGARKLLRANIAATEERPAIRDLALERIDLLALPAEVTAGDLAVSLTRSHLAGCGTDVVLRLDHLQLVRDPAAYGVVARALFGE